MASESDSDEERTTRLFEAFRRDYLPPEHTDTTGAAGSEEDPSFLGERSLFRGNISTIPPVDDSANVLHSFRAGRYDGAGEDAYGTAQGSFAYGFDQSGAEFVGYPAEEEDDGPVVNVVVCEGVVLPVPLLSLPTNNVHTLRQYVTERILDEPGLPVTRRFVSNLHSMKLKQNQITLRDDWDLEVLDPDVDVEADLPEDMQRLLSTILLRSSTPEHEEDHSTPIIPDSTLFLGDDDYDEEDYGDEEVDTPAAAASGLKQLLAVAAGGIIDEREEFHRALNQYRVFHANNNDTATLQQYAEICHRKQGDLDARKKSSAKWELEADEMRLERNTWKLLFDLHTAGFWDDLQPLDKFELEDMIRQMPDSYEPADIINELYQHSRALARWHFVISWLEQTAGQSFFDCDEARLAWEATAKVMHLRQNMKVNSLDPDAQMSDHGLHALEGEDNETQEQLMHNVWLCIRSGQLGLAQQFCEDQKYHWLAAALAGCLFTERVKDDQVPFQRQRFGNLNRPAWLLRAWRYADHLSDRRFTAPGQLYEAAVFATLSGNLQALLDNPHLSSWEDRLWAYFKALHDRVCTWAVHVYNQQRANESNLFPGASVQQLDDGARYLQVSAELDQLDVWEVFTATQAVVSESERPDHQVFYYAVQKAAVLGPEALHEYLVQQGLQLLQSTGVSAHMKRFFAHLGIYLRDKLEDVLATADATADEALDKLILPYIDELDQQRHLQLVALYASYLTDDEQLERFSDFMATVVDSAERQQVLMSAKEVLQVSQILPIVDLAVTKMLTASGGAGGSLTASKDIFIVQPMDEFDQEKIHALEWLQLDQEFFDAAIVQSTRLIRMFVMASNGKKCMLEDILERQLTPDFEQHIADRTAEDDLYAMEFSQWHQYATAVYAVQKWRDIYHKLQHPGARADQQAALEEFARDAVSLLENLITEGFLEIPYEDEPELHNELQACRSIVLRQAVLWLQHISFQTGNVLLACQPQRHQDLRHWWEDAVAVAEIVASDKFKLLEVVSADIIRELLKGVHASSLTLLKLDEQEARHTRR